MIWSVTEEQARVLRDAFDAGPGGLFVPVVGDIGRIASRLVAGDCGTYREEKHWCDTTRSARDPKPIGWLTDYYFVPNAKGLAFIGICPWPKVTAQHPAVTV